MEQPLLDFYLLFYSQRFRLFSTIITFMIKQKYARIERERRFLSPSLPEGFEEKSNGSVIHDRYIIGSNLRLRKIEKPTKKAIQYKLGQKYPVKENMYENVWMTNIYLNKREFDLLLALPANTLKKRRYPLHFKNNKFSIDIFDENLSGLILCEIEIPVDDNSPIELPPFVVEEVTENIKYLGSYLAKKNSNQD